MKAVILASDRGIRRLDSAESTPPSLIEDETGRAVLDYQVEALREAGVQDILVVAGYHIEKVVEAHPEVDFLYNPDWSQGGPLRGLAGDLDALESPCLIASGESIFHEPIVEDLLLNDSDIVAGVQTFPTVEAARTGRKTLDEQEIVQIRDGYITEVGTVDDVSEIARFVGILRLSDAGLERLASWLNRAEQTERSESVNDWTLERLLADWVNEGVSVRSAVVDGNAKRLDGSEDISRFLLGTKADTLDRLQGLVREATVLDQVTFKVQDWSDSRESILREIEDTFESDRVVVRSSAQAEDAWTSSAAGAYHTELGVPRLDTNRLGDAIRRVIRSFDQDPEAASPLDQVLVQPHLDNIVLSGVAFTRELNSGGPYTVINYDSRSGRTDTITAGTTGQHRTFYIYNHLDDREERVENSELRPVVGMIDELRRLLDDPPLDVEFAVDATSEVYILQVRPLAASWQLDRFDLTDVHEELVAAKQAVRDLDSNRPLLYGSGTVLGVMPDWNPAEMIGIEPDPLARSLYRYLITDEVWAKARAVSGYEDVRPIPLMVVLAGRPYIDMLVDFNSFLPADLDPETSERIVDHYLERLIQRPELHDKIEFEIAFTCRDFAFDRRSDQLREAGFTEDEISEFESSLRRLTDDIIAGKKAPIEDQLQRLEQLEPRREELLQRQPESWPHTIQTVAALLHDARRYGTFPFAVLARYAFIATSFLSSLVECGVLSEEEKQAFLRDVPTVANDIKEGISHITTGEMDLSTFLDHFGHLRPGTYDITSPRYDEAPQVYFEDTSNDSSQPKVKDALHHDRRSEHPRAQEIFKRHEKEIENLISDAGFSFGVTELFEFMTSAIQLRERAKFEFTKNLSEALKLLSGGAEKYLDMTPEEIADIPIDEILQIRTENPSAALDRRLRRTAGFNRKRRKIQTAIQMPHLITDPDALQSFEIGTAQPNFVTLQSVTAPVLDLESADDTPELDGRILLIPAADPGYDWIFGHDIAGLITQYGGVASHMAIRAAEFQLPAAIGCGELLFEEVRDAKSVELDCGGRQIRVIQ